MGDIIGQLGDSAKNLLGHKCATIPRDMLTLPGPDFVDRVFAGSDRSNVVLRNLQWMFNGGRSFSASGHYFFREDVSLSARTCEILSYYNLTTKT